VRALKLLALAAMLALAATAPASAQSVDDVDVIAERLDNPRHVAVAPNGDVYVAESGRGGNHMTARSCFDSAEGFACTGATGAVTRISRHRWRYRQKRVAKGLASFAPVGGGNAIGPHGVFVKGDDVFVTNGGPTAPTRGMPPVPVMRDPTLVAEDPISALYGTLLELRRHGRPRLIADIWRFEKERNPDAEVGNPLVDSNPVDVWAGRGRFYVADAGGNSVLRASENGSIDLVSLFPSDPPGPDGINAVPTGVVRGPDGALYVSQLTGFPFLVGTANVFRVDPRTGDPTIYAPGFTNAMDLDFGRDGTLYVLEIARNGLMSGDPTGGLWAVPPGGDPQRIELPAGTLTSPGGLAVGRHDELYVSNHGREAGIGEVLEIELDD
jgi:hypothetical protein